MKLLNKDIETSVNILYNRMFSKWYSGNDSVFNEYQILFDSKGAKEAIKKLLIKGLDVRTGYICTDIKNCHTYFIAYK